METVMGLSVVEVVMLTLGGMGFIGALIAVYIARQENQQED